jgi:hypothetical protein
MARPPVSAPEETPAARRTAPIGVIVRLGLSAALALAIAVGLYVFGTQHIPDYSGTALFGRTAADTLPLKSWPSRRC